MIVWSLVACTGGPVEETTDTPPLEIEGATFLVSFAGLTIPGAEDGFADLLRLAVTRPILIHAAAADDSSVDFRLAVGVEGSDPAVQDACTVTVDFPTAALTGAAFGTEPQDLTFELDQPYTLYDMVVVGEATADSLEDVILEGTLDMRQVSSFFETVGDADEICETTAELGLPCEPCDDGEVYCVWASLQGLRADRVEVEVVAVPPLAASCPTE